MTRFAEGYFVLNHASLAGTQSLFAQLWKEYSLSDSRYLTSDPFMVSIEAVTAVCCFGSRYILKGNAIDHPLLDMQLTWGPLSLATAVSILANSPLRHPLQIVVCVGHLYGVVLYYSTSFAAFHFEAVAHSRPEFLYFWVYYAGFNFPWVVVPLGKLDWKSGSDLR
jgi:cholestenol delta-isomerase